MPLLACPAVFFRELLPALLDKPAVAPFFNGLLGVTVPSRSLRFRGGAGGLSDRR